jgi:dimethylhistidine N-methyltransferase
VGATGDFALNNNFSIVERFVADPQAQRKALVEGLLATPASIAPMYFYDALGCLLYGAICELREYYPTRTERSIFEEHKGAIAKAAGQGKQLVDLGAGDSRKAAAWFPLLGPARYVAVDIAAAEIAKSLARLAPDFPEIRMQGIVTDFSQRLDVEQDLEPGPVTFFYPGSSIGNFAPHEARRFLRDLYGHCAKRDDSGLLIGVDTKKAKARLDAAYDDALGVTAAFNRNVLNHVNTLLGSDFRPEAFAHRGFYSADEGRIEMHLEATSAQTVRLDGAVRIYSAGERIHTENSYKYAPAEFRLLLQEAGFRRVQSWQDAAGDFAVYYAS